MTLPAWTPEHGPDGVADGIAAWLGSAAMTRLLAAFGHRHRPGASLADRLADVDAFSERWNYRRGGERSQAVGEVFRPETDVLIREATAALGFAGGDRPPAMSYDHVLVLGGGVRTMLARAGLAGALLRSGLATGTVAGLGSLRPLTGQEAAARQFGLPPCPTEGDAVDATLRREFALTGPAECRTGPGWWVRGYPDAEPAVHVLAAPATRAGRRANTADTLTAWAGLLAPGLRGARLLLVTTDLFVPFQHCDAVRLLGLGHGARVDTVGLSTATSPWLWTARTFEVLQEVRAAIHALRRLHDAVTAGAGADRA